MVANFGCFSLGHALVRGAVARSRWYSMWAVWLPSRRDDGRGRLGA